MIRRFLAPLCAGLLLLPLASLGQQTPSSHRRARGGGSSKSGESDGTAPMKDLPCPKGFTAETDSGPHLELAQTAAASGRKKKASKDAAKPKAMKKTLARRCVPDKPQSAPKTGKSL